MISKGELHLLLCDHHSDFLDVLMPILSDTCNWLPYVSITMLLIFNWRTGLTLGGGLGLATIITQVLKHIFHAPRPLTWFAEHMPDVELPLTEGVKMHYWDSFPSGHTTTFFALYIGLAVLVPLLVKHRYVLGESSRLSVSVYRMLTVLWCVMCGALCIVSSYSRIYLSQHFLSDVAAGAVIGTCSMLIALAVARKLCHSCHTCAV